MIIICINITDFFILHFLSIITSCFISSHVIVIFTSFSSSLSPPGNACVLLLKGHCLHIFNYLREEVRYLGTSLIRILRGRHILRV